MSRFCTMYGQNTKTHPLHWLAVLYIQWMEFIQWIYIYTHTGWRKGFCIDPFTLKTKRSVSWILWRWACLCCALQLSLSHPRSLSVCSMELSGWFDAIFIRYNLLLCSQFFWACSLLLTGRQRQQKNTVCLSQSRKKSAYDQKSLVALWTSL